MKNFVLPLVVLLIVLHHDFWWRYDHTTVVFGFIPVSLAYHIGISLAASVVWGLACKYAWPRNLDVADSDAWVPPAGGRGH